MAKTDTLRLAAMVVAAILSALLLSLSRAEPTEAAFQGSNGKIFYERNFSVWSMNPDGTGQTKLVGFKDSSERDPAVSPNGTKIAFVYGSHEIAVMSHAGTNPKELTDTLRTEANDNLDPVWSPDGKKIAFSRNEDGPSNDYDIWVMNPDGSGKKNLTNTPDNAEYEPAWSPDGLAIAYTRIGCEQPNAGTSCIYKMFANGLGQMNLTKAEDTKTCEDGGAIDHTLVSNNPTWSPDGSKIAYEGTTSCGAGIGKNIWVMNSDGDEKKDLMQDESTDDYQPSFSPNGQKIVFSSDRGDSEFGHHELYSIDADADEPLSGLKRLTKTQGVDEMYPDWGVRPDAALAMLPQVPGMMRHFGWLNGARLQEKWFAGPPRVVGKDFQIETHTDVLNAPKDNTTIKMDSWVLTFPRAKAKYDELVVQKACINKEAQKEIVELLERQGKLIGKERKPFGNLAAPVPNQDGDYIQQRAVEISFSEMINPNDMAAALGDFNLRCVVAGEVVPNSDRPEYRIDIKELGVYVRDSFDFNGFQPLGSWRADPPYASGVPASGAVSLWNSTYRQWRSENGEGGDFLVFSDLKRKPLSTPFRFIADCGAPRPCEVAPG